ncbi:MAG: hypothetical protein ACLPKB_11495 [Xanthobacteraceae bacterium]
MRKLAIVAGLAGATVMVLAGQASAFPAGTPVTTSHAAEIQTVQYRTARYKERQPGHHVSLYLGLSRSDRLGYSGGARVVGPLGSNDDWSNVYVGLGGIQLVR